MISPTSIEYSQGHILRPHVHWKAEVNNAYIIHTLNKNRFSLQHGAQIIRACRHVRPSYTSRGTAAAEKDIRLSAGDESWSQWCSRTNYVVCYEFGRDGDSFFLDLSLVRPKTDCSCTEGGDLHHGQSASLLLLLLTVDKNKNLRANGVIINYYV